MAPLGNRQQLRASLPLKSWLRHSGSPRYLACSIALTYAVVSLLWIVGSDRLLAAVAPSTEVLTKLQTLKGWFFVSCTSLLLYSLIQRAVRQLRQSHQLLESIINSTQDAIFVKDIRGRCLVVNRTAAELLNRQPETILGQVTDGFLSAQEAERIHAIEQEVYQTGQSQEIEQRLMIAGEPRWFLTTESLCLDDHATPLGIVRVVKDITRRKQAEAALRDSEERLRLALMAANQGLYDVNVQTGEVIVNSTYATMLGYDPAEFRETVEQWVERLHPEERETVVGLYQAYVAGDIQEYKVEFRLRTQRGEWKWMLSMGKIVARDENGQPLRMLGTHTDITDRKQAEVALAESEARFQAFVNNSPSAAWISDVDGRLLYVSQIYRQICQPNVEQTEDLVGKTAFDLYPAEFAQQYLDNIRKVIETDQSVEAIEQALMPNGTLRDFLVYKFPLQGLSGQRLVGGVAIDITERVQAEQVLQHLNQELEARVERRTAALQASQAQQKQIEAQLRKNAAHLAAAQRIARLGSWEFDLQTQEMLWSEEVFRIAGRNPALGPPT